MTNAQKMHFRKILPQDLSRPNRALASADIEDLFKLNVDE